MTLSKFISTLILCFFLTSSFAQEQIWLKNPSFEDTPRIGKAPRAWYNCGFPNESEPDVQPNPDRPFFNVMQQASHGATYIGMVTRDNDTWEMVGQRLSTSLKKETHYHFSVHLCRSDVYVSPSRISKHEVNYTSPVKLRIWGADGYCGKTEMLAESSLVFNTEWEEYFFTFQPEANYKYILFECFYKTPALFPYNGNLLMDNASPITVVTAEMADSIATLDSRLVDGTEKNYVNPNVTDEAFDNFERLTLSEVDSIDAANRNWGTAGALTDTLRKVFAKMEVDFESDEFSKQTKTALFGLLDNISFDEQYEILTIGIMGKNKRRRELSLPFNLLLLEPDFAEFDIKIVKVEVGEMDENWVGKNKYYWFRLE